MSNVALRSRLVEEDLVKLISGEYLAIRVPSFFDAHFCEQLSEKIVRAENLRSFKYATNMQRIGPSLAEMACVEGGVAEYLQDAVDEVGDFRSMCMPMLTPIDLLRLQLDEAWTHGANLARIGRRKTFTGVCRILHDGGFTSPHQDILLSDQLVDLSSRVTEQLAANVYLQTSTDGGELELWNKQLSQAEYQAIRTPGKVGVVRTIIRESDAVISPERGDLIIFRSTHLHAIRSSVGTPRITCSSFIGYQDESKPLLFYC